MEEIKEFCSGSLLKRSDPNDASILYGFIVFWAVVVALIWLFAVCFTEIAARKYYLD